MKGRNHFQTMKVQNDAKNFGVSASGFKSAFRIYSQLFMWTATHHFAEHLSACCILVIQTCLPDYSDCERHGSQSSRFSQACNGRSSDYPPLTLISARSKMERKTKDLWFLFLGLIIRHIESKLTVSQPQLQEPESDNLFPNQRWVSHTA